MTTNTLSDEQIAGQRLMVGFNGISFNSRLKALIGEIKVGGIILFSRNISDPDQLKRLCLDIQSFAHSCNQPPLFISIDQEGGTVARLKPPFTQFPDMAKIGTVDAADHFSGITAEELSSVGINMNLAPVLDTAPLEINSIMRQRSFSHDPKRVAVLGKTVIEGFQQRKIMAVAKHFPGIGRTVLDSHQYLPDLDTDFEELADSDLVPFRSAVSANVSGIMLSHIRYTSLDPQWPASISAKIARKLLREELGYNGMVMTDDLDMAAIKEHFPLNSVMDNIIDADIDVALICHDSPDIQAAFEHLLARFTTSTALKERITQSADRILGLKKRFLMS